MAVVRERGLYHARFTNPVAVVSSRRQYVRASRQDDLRGSPSNTQTGTIQVVGEFPNSRNLLRPGQYARIQAPTGNITGALLVPQAAVNQQQGTYQVTVVGADNRAQLRTVAVGPRVDTLWVITSGLKPGERVVAVGAEKTKQGELVNPTPYTETEER